ncbi:Tyrosinase [Psilocybe cubensis]|uniref:tyrosinase n=2 Tax=Psilocybe cubensis TaxID=181762 RepID=A0A8H7Y473_PSICU|nr:Tyrosinase [Psilocybe cubensis]KAH9484703.1 Tyrosinase [Psilocybe cubensis]
MAQRVVVDGSQPRPQPGQLVHSRREIATFVNDVRQFSLYVQALQIYYDRVRTDVVSHWQIGGIHGQPYVDWNGTPSGGRGYCVHRTPLFPTWHRPYIVLFEQEVQKIAREIAAAYTHDRPAWEEAAAALRQPYWGWDNIATVVPPLQVTTSPTVNIVKAHSPTPVSVPNPFLTYAYPAGANSVFSPPFNIWPRTTRHPDASGNSQPALLRAALEAVGPQIVNNTQRLMSITTWDAFTLGSAGTTGLEGIHDTIHVQTGGQNGNMAFVPVAAFDPIFYLHHAQVDRVIDLWYSRHRVWTANTDDLLPFRRTQTAYWKSPEIIDNSGVFNYSYGGIVNVQSESGEGAAVDEQSAASMGTNLEWSVRVECKEYEIGGSFSVYVFMSNEVPSNQAEWLFHPTFAGTFDVFANPHPEECANCSAHADETIKGFIHINKKYLERSKKATLDPAVVIPYLKEHISWAVVKANGEVADIHKFSSLKVTVICMPLTLTDGAHYPVEGHPKIYPEITRGRVGGSELE